MGYKRGPKIGDPSKPNYDVRGRFRVSREERDFVRRRVSGFLRNCHHYTLEHLLSEAYLQGLRDAGEVSHG